MKNILRKISIIFVIFSLSLSSFIVSNAATTNYNNDIALISDETNDRPVLNVTDSLDENSNTDENSEEETVTDSNYFYVGSDDVTISKDTQGDVFVCTSGNLTINADISGNVFAIASSITLSENYEIYSSLFSVSKELHIFGSVNNNAYIVTKQFEHAGQIQNDLYVTSENVTINGNVFRDANIDAKEISISEESYVSGNLNYSSPKEIELGEDVVFGDVNYSKSSSKSASTFKFTGFLYNILTYVIFTVVLFFIFKFIKCKFMNNSYNLKLNILKCLLFGLLGVILVPIISVILLFPGITVSLSFVLLAIYILSLLISTSIAIIVLSKLLSYKLEDSLDKINPTLLTVLTVIVLSIIYKALQLIPAFGTLVSFILVFIGNGILITSILPNKKQ